MFSYETQPFPADKISPNDFMALLNQEGAKGFFLQWDSYNKDFGLIFVNDGSGQTYSYETLPLQFYQSDFMAQVNDEGAKGYRFEVSFYGTFLTTTNNNNQSISFALYRKNNGSPAKYAYATATTPASAEDFLAQLNQWGQGGYLLHPIRDFANLNLYVRDYASKSIYTYNVPAAPTTLSDFLTQLNSEGANGYRALYINNNGGVIYVKDMAQLATFAYQTDPTSPTIDKMNSYGRQGYAYLGFMSAGHYYYDSTTDEYNYITGPAAGYYVTANNCSGWMCTVHSPVLGSDFPVMFPPSPDSVATN